MSLENIYVISQIVAAIAVVASLVFVGVQLRESRRASEMQSLSVALGGHVKQIADLTGCDADAELFRKFSLRFDLLTLNERGRIHSMLLERLASFNQVRLLHAAGVLRGDEFLAIRDTFLSILRTPGGRQWWGLYRSQVPLSLNNYLSSMLDDPSITRPPMHEHFPWLFSVEEQQEALRGDAAS